MVGTAGVEDQTSSSRPRRLALNPQEARTAKVNSEIERLAPAKRSEDVVTANRKSTKYCRLSRVPSARRSHTATLCLRSDGTYVRLDAFRPTRISWRPAPVAQLDRARPSGG